MEVVVKLFAALRERAQAKAVTVRVPDGATVGALCAQLIIDYPALALAMESAIVVINQQFVPPEARIEAGAEVAIFPPVSGGAAWPELCQVSPNDVDVGEIIRDLTFPTTGAVVAFTGTVRAYSRDKCVAQLYYEAYAPMAEARLRQVAAEMRERFPEIEGVALIQRTGTLEAGEITTVVAVSSPHREQCFEAARYGIDRIKEIVPVWKKEIGPEGEMWIEGHYRPQTGE